MLKKILAVALLIVAAIAIAQGPPINRPPIVDQGNVTITGGTITGLSSPLPVASGGTNAASASITAFNNITGYTAAGATGTTSTNLVFSTSPTFVTPVLGAATATSINGNTITTGTGTLTLAASKTLTANNTLTLAGTDGTTMTFPSTSATVARTDAANSFAGAQTITAVTNWVEASLAGGDAWALKDTSDTASATFISFRKASGAAIGSVTRNVATDAVLYNIASDYRLKKNPQPLVGSGAFIDGLKPKSWRWLNGDPGAGFIAHEFAEVSPSSVVGRKDAVDEKGVPIYQAMQASTAEVMANIVAELQALRARVASLEKKK